MNHVQFHYCLKQESDSGNHEPCSIIFAECYLMFPYLNLKFYTISEAVQASGSSVQSHILASVVAEDLRDENPKLEAGSDSDNDKPAEENVEGDFTKLTGRQKKLFELRLKMVSFH